jgi:hypothetical protein
MVHGPCGELNPTAPCIVDGQCTKGFPCPFREETQLNTKDYPEYHTPNDGCQYKVGNHWVNNSWIIPYNAWLLAHYNCHINVQTSVSFAALKYITKYIHKGPDQATVRVEDGNEIDKFLDSRYVSLCKSAFRLFHFDLHKHSPSVMRLQVHFILQVEFCQLVLMQIQVHLPGQHLVRFNPNEDAQTVLERAVHKTTMLTGFFAMNANEMWGPIA